MFPDMTSDHPESNQTGTSKTILHRVGENLYRHETTGGYYGLVKRGGKQFRRSLRTKDRKLAERRLADLRVKVENLTITADSYLPFEAVATRWLETVRHRVKASTACRIQTALKGIAPFFQGKSIRHVGRKECDEWQVKRGPGIAPQTFAHELAALNGVMNYAVERGFILSNPAAGIKRRPIRTAKLTVPSLGQFQQLVTAIRVSDGRSDSQAKAKPGADLLELLAYSGMRLREATSLLWKHVDLDAESIRVCGGEFGTKNGEERTVPMTAALKELLVRLHREAGERTPDTLVARVKDCKTALGKCCQRLGFPHFTHHDFRHFFATTCIEAGVDIPTISRWLGHKDGGALAMRVYGHLRDEHSRAAIRKVSFNPAVNVVAFENTQAVAGGE